jgi:uncharacterized protein DUF4145
LNAIQCPNCKCLTPDDPMLYQGIAYTSRGIIVTGTLDDRTGDVAAGKDSSLYVRYRVTSVTYRIVQCLKCVTEFVVKHGLPLKVVYPEPDLNVETPKEIPEGVRSVLIEAKKAHLSNLETASLLAARTALIRMLRERASSGIDDLADKGVITQFLAEQAHEIRLWANAVGHDDIPADLPNSEDVDQLLGFLDLLFDSIYVQPAKLATLRAKRPGGKAV